MRFFPVRFFHMCFFPVRFFPVTIFFMPKIERFDSLIWAKYKYIWKNVPLERGIVSLYSQKKKKKKKNSQVPSMVNSGEAVKKREYLGCARREDLAGKGLR